MLTIALLGFITSLITIRPYIKLVTSEVKFTHIAKEYKSNFKLNNKSVDTSNNKKKFEKADDEVSLDTQITLNLFEDLKYDLKTIRSGSRVKPVYLSKLPKDLKKIKSTQKKKDTFIKIVMPLIIDENSKILDNRKKLFKILGKQNNSRGEKVWLKRRFEDYEIKNEDVTELKVRMDIIPVSIAIAQAAKESGWGTSRFALEGNALFGQWTWSKKGISPKNKDPNQTHKILQFQILKASVRAYKNNLNTHNAYREFREARAQLRQKNEIINGLHLTKYLKNYASIGEKYVAILEDIIEKNRLTDFDKADLLPTKLKTGVAL